MATQLEKVKNLIDLMIQYEEIIGDLYEKYKKRFPEFVLWGRLVKDERLHARLLKQLTGKTDFKKLTIDTKIFPEKMIFKSIVSTKKMINSPNDLNLVEALSDAFKLECLMIESNYFKVFRSNDREFEKIFIFLEESTKQHSQKIFTELKKLK